jgi:AraC family transcriptional regulator
VGNDRTEYERHINRVIDHIIWKAMTGETVGEFVQRVRLEGAASSLLLRPQADVLTIALDDGFDSASAYPRGAR